MPHSNQTLVEVLLAFASPLMVAPLLLIKVAAVVVTVGVPAGLKVAVAATLEFTVTVQLPVPVQPPPHPPKVEPAAGVAVRKDVARKADSSRLFFRAGHAGAA